MEKSEKVDFASLARSIEVGHRGKAKKLGDGLDDALGEVAKMVKVVGGKGTVKLTLKVSSDGGHDVLVAASIDIKKPELKTFPIRAYVDSRGNLVADDPEQPVIPGMKVVKGAGTE